MHTMAVSQATVDGAGLITSLVSCTTAETSEGIVRVLNVSVVLFIVQVGNMIVDRDTDWEFSASSI